MFISVKRHEREKQVLVAGSNRLTDAILKGSPQGLFLLDAKDKILPQVSQSLTTLFRRQDFSNVSFEKLIGPLVTAKTLAVARAFLARLLDVGGTADGAPAHAAAPDAAEPANPLQDVEVRLVNADGTSESAHYSFEFNAVDFPGEPRSWLVRVTDITAQVQQQRELEDLRTQMQVQGEILRSVLSAGPARFGAFLRRTDAAMKTINGVLKKPARETDAFRSKIEETVAEVDRLRRDAAALKLAGFETAARLLEDSLQELGTRGRVSGSDFLPLAVKLDQLYGQFALLRSLCAQAGPLGESENGTQIIEAPKLRADTAQAAAAPKAQRMAQAGSLDSTLTALTELVANEHKKTVVLECTGLQLVPQRYQATIKNVAIQLIRNAVMHGIETPADRSRAGKQAHGTLQLEFKANPDQTFELHFQDDGAGLNAEQVRATAVARGLLTEDAAARMRDRQAIKLIFKSGYSTLASAPGEPPHGTGMSLVRRYVHEAGGKIALATLLGHETRFKVTLPAPADADSKEAASAQVA
jgi:hypothetical protein